MNKLTDSRRSVLGILSGRKSLYRVSGNPSGARAAVLNEEIEAHLDRKVPSHRLVGVTLADISALESSFKAQTEALSHSMWVLAGLLGMLRNDGYSPRDLPLFNQFVASLSMGMAFQANATCNGTAFSVLKRREYYNSHLPSYISEQQKAHLL